MMLLAFTLDDWRCALELSAVQRAYRAVAVTPLPDAPEIVLGIVNVKGSVLPVVDIRQRFRLPGRNLSPNDQLLVVQAASRRVVIVVDDIQGVIDFPDQDITSTQSVSPGLEYVTGIARLKDGMILIHDLTTFLSLEETAALDQALEGAAS